ncbi:hypothetical protein JL37_17285 [Achromobacter sp. RTa]|uniref:hypothetical protein n=1 Tax=Achromobacter sp. RTa TaxID=1532557 RepID=UPI00050FDFE1|nr:hypothetical protein [Achromobacter sp. RTa]KGD92400.1 hypothetical protein JL37_17285 [Achromobacter sp. RTa]
MVVKRLLFATSAITLMGLAGLAQAQSLVLPSAAEATAAVAEMLSDYDLGVAPKAKLGTCVAAVDAKHPGQVACTVAVTLGAAVNENQLDFYKQGRQWKAQPSVSQDKLPFPDPKLN